MRPCRVVIDPPGFGDARGVTETVEDVLIQALVAQPAIEALDEDILCRLSRHDLVPLDVGGAHPSQDRMTGQFRPIVGDDHLRSTPMGDKPGQFLGDPHAGQGLIDEHGQGFPGEVVDNTERSEAAAIAEGIRHEVQAPSFICLFRQEYGWARACRLFPSAALFHGQSLLGIDAVDLLVIGAETFATQQDAEPSIAEPAAFTGRLSQPLAQRLVSAIAFVILEGGPIEIGQPTGPTLRQAMHFHYVVYGLALRIGRQKFFVARSFRAALSSIASARRRFSFEFSSSSVFSRRASDTVMPPNFALYL